MYGITYRPFMAVRPPLSVPTLVVPNGLADRGASNLMAVLPHETTSLAGLRRFYEYLANRYTARSGMTPGEVRFAPWYGLRAPRLTTPAPNSPFYASAFQQAVATVLNRNPNATLGDLKRYIETRQPL